MALGVLLFLFLLRRIATALGALVDDVLYGLSCAGLGAPAGFVSLVRDALVRYLDRPAAPWPIFPDALGATKQR